MQVQLRWCTYKKINANKLNKIRLWIFFKAILHDKIFFVSYVYVLIKQFEI